MTYQSKSTTSIYQDVVRTIWKGTIVSYYCECTLWDPQTTLIAWVPMFKSDLNKQEATTEKI
jgi:hypothetical protein